MPAQLAASLIELGAGIHSGALRQAYDRHKPTGALGKVELEDFAKEFAARFQQGPFSSFKAAVAFEAAALSFFSCWPN